MYYLTEAVKIIEHYRDAGHRIGLCNGCFDHLHEGHINLLTIAIKACDVLVIGVNTDAYIKKHKGRTRPHFDYDQRIETISRAIEPRVAILIVEQQEESALMLVKTLKPDVLIKSTEYPYCQEVQFMQSLNKPILWVSRTENVSTTIKIREFTR